MKKLLIALLVCFAALGAQAQAAQNLNGSHNVRDTVTNGGTTTWTSARVPTGNNVTIYVDVTKISGTVGGTITFQGSFDLPSANKWKAINTVGTQTASATVTATDASNTYHVYLAGNPFPYYRVSWTGTGTMAASALVKL